MATRELLGESSSHSEGLKLGLEEGTCPFHLMISVLGGSLLTVVIWKLPQGTKLRARANYQVGKVKIWKILGP